MIAEYDEVKGERVKGVDGDPFTSSPSHLFTFFQGGRQYALGQTHKHLPEMVKVCGLDFAPVFSPIVVPHLSGMEVTVPLFDADIAAIKDCYRKAYGDSQRGRDIPVACQGSTISSPEGLVRFVDDPAAAEGGFLSSAGLSERDTLEVSVYGNAERAILVARFDNLGKGASGAAIQNMNIALGVEETTGLVK